MLAYLSLGTNIDPENNAVNMVKKLCQEFGNVMIYPFVYTKAVHMDHPSVFINSLALIDTQYSKEKLKSILNTIEEELGRDRNDPLKSIKDRPADIDIITMKENFDEDFFLENNNETYITACLHKDNKSQPANLKIYGLPSFERTTTVNWNRHTRKIIIVENEFQSLING